MTWKAWLASPDLSQRQELGANMISFTGIARHIAGGEWTANVVPAVWNVVEPWMPLTADTAPPVFAVLDGSTVVLAGPVRQAAIVRNGATVSCTLSGVDDYANVLGGRLIWPQPADAPPWTTDAYQTLTGQASSVVAALIRTQRGDLARSERQGTALVVIDGGAGASGTWQYRLAPLADAVADLARENGLTVSVARRLASNDIVVSIGAVRNRTTLVLDDSKLGDSTLSRSAATATTVIAGGSGAGTGRLFAIAGAAASGDARLEAFSDQRSIGSQPTLQRSADATRAAGAASSAFGGAISAAAAAAYQWHTHYELGDTITLRVGASAWPVTVEAVALSWDTNGQIATPVLGTTPRHALAQLLVDVGGLADRLNNIEVT